MKNLKHGELYKGIVVFQNPVVSKGSNGNAFLNLHVSDGQTVLGAKVWSYCGEAPKSGTVHKIQAEGNVYKGVLQLIITSFEEVPAGEYDPALFLGQSPIPLDERKKMVLEYIEQIKKPAVKAMVIKALKPVSEAFMLAPGAKYHHHNYIGGLVEHSLGVVKNALNLATADTDIDMIIAGALLHDIGKIEQYDWKTASVELTVEGELLGHIVLGLNYLGRIGIDTSSPEYKHLLHIVASHHGKYEWGSPVLPRTKEAYMIHNADVMDDHIWKLDHAAKDIAPETWTEKVPGLDRTFFKF